ncbi:MAG: hypothetical protein WC966_07450 [Bradymonadales bacterium]|jgi:hypothetical protein
MAKINDKNQDIKSALQRYSKDELVDLMDHVLRIYVLNESVQIDTKLSKPETIKELAGLTFAQLLTTLQSSLELDELSQFRVTPYTVYVRIGELELDMNGPTPILGRAGAEEAPKSSDPFADDDDDEMSPAERMDAMENKPWRTTYVAPKPPVSTVETPSMAELFANDKPGERGFTISMEPPTLAEEEDDEPPIADFAPGDDPGVEPSADAGQDFAKTAQSREEKAAPPPPPELAEGDKQINPSNRFASLDLD